MTVAALDIGGSKIAAASVDASHRASKVSSVATPVADQAACLAAIESLLEPLLDGVDVIGVCSAGPFTLDRTPRPLNIPALHDVDLAGHLASWSQRRVVVLNDAQALAIAEGVQGAARDVVNHAAVTVSTGVGAGVVVDGRLLIGGTGNAGHLGHVRVASSGPRCSCGRNGCLESMISGTAIAQLTGRPAAEASADVVTTSAQFLGEALIDLVTLLDLDLVTLAGSVALGWGEPFRQGVERVLQEQGAFDYVRQVPVVLSQLGVASGLIGAAVYARSV